MSKRRRISGEAPPPDDGAPPGIRFVFIRNDGTAQHLIWLVQLKAIFSTQLPKMPPQYIVRLVFDRKHESLLMLKEHEVTLGGTTETVETVVGGVAFRVFDSQKCVSPPARPASLSLSLSLTLRVPSPTPTPALFFLPLTLHLRTQVCRDCVPRHLRRPPGPRLRDSRHEPP